VTPNEFVVLITYTRSGVGVFLMDERNQLSVASFRMDRSDDRAKNREIIREANQFGKQWAENHGFPVIPLFDCYGCFDPKPEYYMIHDSLWEEVATYGNHGMLCFACVQKRLGRLLGLDDFTAAPVNDWVFDHFNKRRCYFISGHLTLTQEEFDQHYAKMIDLAIDEGASFVVGDARGADTMAQQYLKDKGVSPDRVRVYHMHESPRNNVGWPTLEGFGTDDERDAAMTENSHRDIAWVRPGRETSGTARNLARRWGRTTLGPSIKQ